MGTMVGKGIPSTTKEATVTGAGEVIKAESTKDLVDYGDSSNEEQKENKKEDEIE